MGMGKHYTPDEDKRLLKLYRDNPNVPYTKLGEMACDYGIVESRNPSAVAQHIRNLIEMQNNGGEPDEEETQYEMGLFRDTEYAIVKKERDKLKSVIEELQKKYDELIDGIIESSTLFPGTYHDSLCLDFGEIKKLLDIHAPEKVEERLKLLRKEYDLVEKKKKTRKRGGRA